MTSQLVNMEATFENGSKVSLSIANGSHYFGFKKADLIEVTFLTPCSVGLDGEGDCYDCNYSEIYPMTGDGMLKASLAFLWRVGAENHFKHSPFYMELESFLEKE